MRNPYLLLIFFVITVFFSCNQDLEFEKATFNERGDTDDDAITTLFNQELLFKNKLTGDHLLINVGSNFEKNLSFYLNAFDIKVNVDGSEFQFDEEQKNLGDPSFLRNKRDNESFDPKNNHFEIKFLEASFKLDSKSISVKLEPLSKNNAQLLFPQSVTEITSPIGNKWGRVIRPFIFGNDDINTPNSNPGYFIAYPSRRSCGLCFWTDEWNQTKEFPNVGDQLIFGSDSWVRVRFKIRHDAQNFSVFFKRNSSDPW